MGCETPEEVRIARMSFFSLEVKVVTYTLVANPALVRASRPCGCSRRGAANFRNQGVLTSKVSGEAKGS
jgi:hypothetical protein